MRMDAGRPPSSAFGFEWVYSWRGSPRTRVPNVLGWAGHPGRKGARPTSKGGPNRSDVIQSSGHAHSMFRLRWAVLVLADVGYAMPCPHGTEPPVLGAFTTLTLAPPNGPSLFRWWVTPRTPADPVQRRGGRTPAAAGLVAPQSRNIVAQQQSRAAARWRPFVARVVAGYRSAGNAQIIPNSDIQCTSWF